MDSTTFEGTATTEQTASAPLATGPRPTAGRIVLVTYPDGRTFPAIVIADLETSLSVCLFTDSGAQGYYAQNDQWAWPAAASTAVESHAGAATTEAYSGLATPPATDPAPTS